MRKTYLTFFTVILYLITNAQKEKPQAVAVLGLVRDSATNQVLANITVRLKDVASAGHNYAVVTDSVGHFRIDKVYPSTYNISAEAVGYTPQQKTKLVINASKPEWVLDAFYLSAKTRTLGNVVVTGTRSLIENKIDRIVYNVEKDVTSQGGMATDVLRKIPQVSVDINGNVELLGNPSIRFLINGKPSVIFGNSVADALQSIPASQIQSIEVISSPGSRYDATGTGGIINIILKKTKASGFGGVVNATAGTRQESGSINLNFKKDNIAVSGYFSGNALIKVKTLSDLTRNTFDTSSGSKYYLGQNGSSDFQRNGLRTGVGLDWDISSRDNFSLSLGYNQFGNTNNGVVGQQSSGVDKNGNPIYNDMNTRNANTQFQVHSIELNGDYRRKFRREREELSISFGLSTDDDYTSYLQTQKYITVDSIFSGSTSKNPGKDHLATFSVDYSLPASKNVLLEAGVKAEIESLVSDANVYSFNPAGYQFVLDDKQSYTSTFNRNIYASYLSSTFKAFNWLDVIAGVRWEYTVNNATYSNTHGVTIPDYSNMGPSLTLSHTFEKQQTLKFSYAYRLERPEYRDLNPFVNLADPHNISTGNPNIKPEIGHVYQLGYNYNFGKDNNLNIVLLYNHNSPDIKSYTAFYPTYQVGDSIYQNVNVTKRSDIASEYRWGVNLSGGFTIASRLTIRPNIQLYERTTDNIYATPAKVTGFEYRTTLNANYQFDHGLVAEVFGSYRSGIKWQGRQPAFSTYSIAVKQQLFKGKGSLGLVAVNAFSKYLTQTSTQLGTGFTSITNLHIPYRSFGITFMYKFGKVKIKQKEDDNYLTKPPAEN